jgi:hypothetical protein
MVFCCMIWYSLVGGYKSVLQGHAVCVSKSSYCCALKSYWWVCRFKECASPFNRMHSDNGPRCWPHCVRSVVREITSTDEIKTKITVGQCRSDLTRYGVTGLQCNGWATVCEGERKAWRLACYLMPALRAARSEVLHSECLLTLVCMYAICLTH